MGDLVASEQSRTAESNGAAPSPKVPAGGVVGLGHVVLQAKDPQALSEFYRDTLGLAVTETDKDYNLTFLTSRPGEVFHDLGFTRVAQLSHIAYEVDSLTTLRRFYHHLQERGVKIAYVMNFGWSIGVTFEDPEGHRVELYWLTGRARPHRAPIDLDLKDEEIAAVLDQLP